MSADYVGRKVIPLKEVIIDPGVLRVDPAKCIRITKEVLLLKADLWITVDTQGRLLSGYEEYLVAHTLGHTYIGMS